MPEPLPWLSRAGERQAAVPPMGERIGVDDPLDDFRGDCEGATHVISALTVGAFKLTTLAEAQVGGGGSFMVAGADAMSDARRATLNQDGNLPACESGTAHDWSPPDGCAAPVRLEVSSLPPGDLPTCQDGTHRDGFRCVGDNDGAGLGALFMLLAL